MDYVLAGDPPSQIAEELDLSEQQVQAAMEYISPHRDEVEAQYEAILKRVSQPNPDWVEAGRAETWDELRRRIAARSRGEPRMLVAGDNDVGGAVHVLLRRVEWPFF